MSFLDKDAKLKHILSVVQVEYLRAASMHKPFNSAHEGYAIILEEFEELKNEIFKKKHVRDSNLMKEEAIQVAAMVVRFMMDLL